MGVVGQTGWLRPNLGGLLLTGLLLLSPAAWSQAAEPGAATLTIHVENVGPGGLVRLGLYDEAGYPDDKSKPIAFADVPAVPGETVIVLRNLRPGTYAIETYQDVNGNDKMDTTWLGLPMEPYGFSRDAEPFLSKPSFSRVKFAVHAGAQSQTVHLQNRDSR